MSEFMHLLGALVHLLSVTGVKRLSLSCRGVSPKHGSVNEHETLAIQYVHSKV